MHGGGERGRLGDLRRDMVASDPHEDPPEQSAVRPGFGFYLFLSLRYLAHHVGPPGCTAGHAGRISGEAAL